MWLDIAMSRLLSLDKDENRRVWFVLDEMPTLQKLPFLTSTFAEARKFGGCFVVGLQAISQLKEVYGKDESETISNLCNTRFYLSCPDVTSAEWSSRQLGEIETEEPRESYSYGANTMGDRVSVGQQRFKRPLVSPSEITMLKALFTYVRLPGEWPITSFYLKYEKPKDDVPGFIKRNINEQALQDIAKLVNNCERPMTDSDDEKIYKQKPNLEPTNDSIFG